MNSTLDFTAPPDFNFNLCDSVIAILCLFIVMIPFLPSPFEKYPDLFMAYIVACDLLRMRKWKLYAHDGCGFNLDAALL